MLFEELTEIIDPEAHDAALNMAIDETLLREAVSPMFRVYGWLRPAVSFGYFGRYDAVTAAWSSREIVRRWTGGGIVLHGEDITYTLVVPKENGFSRNRARDSYRMIHERIAWYLSQEGQSVRIAEAPAAKVSDACFENPVEFDLVADGSKIAGAAQRRAQGGLLHQGSILREGMSRASCENLAAAFAVRVVRRELSTGEFERAQVLAAQKYATEAWLKKF